MELVGGYVYWMVYVYSVRCKDFNDLFVSCRAGRGELDDIILEFGILLVAMG